jgi:hypothetical protein
VADVICSEKFKVGMEYQQMCEEHGKNLHLPMEFSTLEIKD